MKHSVFICKIHLEILSILAHNGLSDLKWGTPAKIFFPIFCYINFSPCDHSWIRGFVEDAFYDDFNNIP